MRYLENIVNPDPLVLEYVLKQRQGKSLEELVFNNRRNLQNLLDYLVNFAFEFTPAREVVVRNMVTEGVMTVIQTDIQLFCKPSFSDITTSRLDVYTGGEILPDLCDLTGEIQCRSTYRTICERHKQALQEDYIPAQWVLGIVLHSIDEVLMKNTRIRPLQNSMKHKSLYFPPSTSEIPDQMQNQDMVRGPSVNENESRSP